MGWEYLAILFAVSLALSAVGFYKYVYFLSIGYGFAVAGIGITLFILGLCGAFNLLVPHYILLLLLVIYGIRLSGFLFVRELKNTSYRKTLKEVTGDEKKMPVFVKFSIWLCVGVLYVAQTSPVFFRLYNGSEDTGSVTGSTWLIWTAIAICVIAVILEAAADSQKSAQKKKRPDMVATEGLYKIVRCPNYFGEILFWTGIFISGIDIYSGAGQWITAVIAYICIVYIMFNGAQRLEKRQMGRYGQNDEYKRYADKTPIIIPLLPVYHLNKQKK